MAQGKDRLAHPPVESLIAAVVVLIVVVVSLAIGSLLSVTPVEPTFPDPVDRPVLVMGPAGLDLRLVQTA